MCQLIQMTKPGAGIFGLDRENHLWIVLSDPTPTDEIAVVMLFKHGRPRLRDHASCTVIRRGEYQELDSDVCVEMRRLSLRPWRPLLKGLDDGELQRKPTVEPAVLCRIQQAVLTSEVPPDRVREAVRQTIEYGA